jgi:AraC-type DNA-binding domain-containing proteins
MLRISRDELAKDIVFSTKNGPPSDSEQITNDKLFFHDWFELFYVKAGDVAWFIEDEVHQVSPHSLVLFNDKEVHKLQMRTNKRFERMKLLFNPALARHFDLGGFDPLSCFVDRPVGRRNIVVLSPTQSQVLLSLFQKLSSASASDAPEAPLLELSAFLEILGFANRAFSDAPELEEGDGLSEKVATLMKYIDAHIEGDLSLDALSSSQGLSRYYLCRIFKKETGGTLHDYVLFKRVSLAKQLLEDGISLARVSRSCGFGSMSRFSAAFKAVLGFTPSSYSKKHKLIP